MSNLLLQLTHSVEEGEEVLKRTRGEMREDISNLQNHHHHPLPSSTSSHHHQNNDDHQTHQQEEEEEEEERRCPVDHEMIKKREDQLLKQRHLILEKKVN